MKIIIHNSLIEKFTVEEIDSISVFPDASPNTEMQRLGNITVIKPVNLPMNLTGEYGDGTDYTLMYDDETE